MNAENETEVINNEGSTKAAVPRVPVNFRCCYTYILILLLAAAAAAATVADAFSHPFRRFQFYALQEKTTNITVTFLYFDFFLCTLVTK